MIRQSKNPIVMPALLDALLATLSTRPAGALLSAPKVQLITNTSQLTKANVYADLTQATFAGYADVNLPTVSGPANLTNGSRGVYANVNYEAGAIVAPGQTITGYALVDGAGTLIYMVEQFETPVPFAIAGDFLDLMVVVPENVVRPTGD